MNLPETNVLRQTLVNKSLEFMPSVLVGDVDLRGQLVSWWRCESVDELTRVNLAV